MWRLSPTYIPMLSSTIFPCGINGLSQPLSTNSCSDFALRRLAAYCSFFQSQITNALSASNLRD
ncbi:hypothetical protein LguiA_002885 [Lonicera macranthoides]